MRLSLLKSLLVCSTLMVACGTEEEASPTPTATPNASPEDLRRTFPTPGENTLALYTPDMVVPSGEDKMFCYFQTFTGDDSGIVAVTSFQSNYGHHSVLLVSNGDSADYPDGQLFDCTGKNALPMTNIEPLVVGGSSVPDDQGLINSFRLPDDLGVMAGLLRQGKRIVVQSHYVNTTSRDILVRDAVFLEMVPEDTVEIWAAAFVQNNDEFSIPPNTAEYSVSSEYTFEEELNVLYITGHMHEWGKRYDVELTHNGTLETIYEVEKWDPYYRDNPYYVQFDLGSFKFMPGDTIKSTCTWFSDRDTPLEFPDEMCSTVTMVFPSKVPLIVGP